MGPDRSARDAALIIETPRFLLRPLTPEDASERYSRWFDDPVASSYILSAKSAHDVPALRAYIEERAGRSDVVFLGIFTRERGDHIGTIKYEPIDFERRRAVMGVLIGEPEWRGKGAATEVLDASGRWLKAELGIDAIVLGVERAHDAAMKAYTKVGFVPEPAPEIPELDYVVPMVWHIP